MMTHATNSPTPTAPRAQPQISSQRELSRIEADCQFALRLIQLVQDGSLRIKDDRRLTIAASFVIASIRELDHALEDNRTRHYLPADERTASLLA